MNQDYHLSTQSQGSPDFWTQTPASIQPYAPQTAPAAGRSSGSQSAKPSPLQKINRLLRGRYPLAIALAVAGALTGAAAGFMALPPKYEGPGFVAVNPVVVTPGPGEPIVPMLTMSIQTQVGLIGGADVADRALHDKSFSDNRAMVAAWEAAHPKTPLPISFTDPDEIYIRAWMQEHPDMPLPLTFQEAWDIAYPNAPLPTVSDFMAAVDPEHVRNGSLIRVGFTDKNKLVAEAGCRAVLASYMALHGKGDQFSMVDERVALNVALRDAAIKDQLHFITELNQYREVYGTTDLADRNNHMQDDLLTLDKEVTSAEFEYQNAKAVLEGKSAAPERMDMEEIFSRIAAVDPPMRVLLQQRDADQFHFDNDIKRRLGPKNPGYINALAICAEDQEKVEAYAKRYIASHPNLALNGAGIVESITPEMVSRLKRLWEDKKKQLEVARNDAKNLGALIDQIKQANEGIKQQQATIDTCNSRIKDLEANRALSKPVLLTDPGGEAQIPTDKRKLVAGIGFTFGGLLPIGLMLLYGLTENRYRFSSDANEHEMLGVTLLGILPNLPDRLSDPQQAGVAAHCVHQIRTMLQISRSNDEPQVLAVTSASSGDGKTSLTLALGLSYAACGARTLLVDCDLVAAGLTHRLNVTSTDGVLEAVANRALLEYVRTTDIADVAILPVGTTHAHHASTLSPVALRRLISEGKKHFDIIIIDTGPLLGSIEASLVCAAADRSILAVARNQQRPLVERSIRHLQEIGAQLAGVVFNRAHASDFERSMSGLALRSRPATSPGGPTPPRDMAGSFKKKAG